MKETKIRIQLQPLNIGFLKVGIRGITPLLMDKFPEEAKEQILLKQTGISKTNKKKVRDTKKEILSAIHTTSTGKIGFPADAFKKAMLDCTSLVGDKFFSKKLVAGISMINTIDGLVLLKFKKQDVLKHNIGANTKFSPQFHDWSCELEIQHDKNNISAQDIITLINYAGFYIGIGAWRKKCRDGGTGNFGQFEVKKEKLKKGDN
jgi:hypothetical protein